MATAALPHDTTTPPPVNGRVLAIAAAALLVVAGLAYAERGLNQALLVGIGALLGLSLYHASFGFTSAWRRFIQTGEGAGLRAQMLMLAIAVCLFFPPLAAGELFGSRVGGFVAPVGMSVAIGAFIFGIGMQLGGGCASGTLFTVGGGSTRMVITLICFILGSVIATHHLGWWLSLPNMGPYSIVKQWGLGPALAAHLGLFAAVAAITWLVEKRAGISAKPPVIGNLLRGPWPIIWGAVALALLNFATLVLAGRPWGITSGFALWGAKWFDMAGVDVQSWSYWARSTAVDASIFRDTTSVMNFGIIAGAMAAAALAGKFAPNLKLSRRDVLTAIIGGLLLGYGARLAFGCNIGAFFSGIASSSLHGWLWLVCGFLGNIVGTRVRTAVGL